MRTPYRATQLGGIANLALMARVRQGFVSGFETITYARRLELLFQALNGSRQSGREALRVPSPFQDSVGRWALVQSFRYALYGPDDEPEAAGEPDAPHRVYLNVAFDGGWEPYLRVIYRDLGSLLDAIFCNCEGYPLARTSPYADYENWVRSHEIDGGIWYTDSALSVGDQRYLAQVEKIQRETADPAAADLAIARLALPDAQTAGKQALARALANPLAALDQAFRSLSGLYALRPLYPDSGTEGKVLRRFARDALTDLRLLIDSGLFVDLLTNLAQDAEKAGRPDAAAALRAAHLAALTLQKDHAAELTWLAVNPDEIVPAAASDWPRDQVQGGVVTQAPTATHGALVMLRVTDARRAAAALANPRKLAPHSAADTAAAAPSSRVWRTVAISASGLHALGVPDGVWQQFPQEFADGMEARAGLLGDVRGNHPDHWQRPRPWRADAAPPLDLQTVHVVLILRTFDKAAASHDLHPRLRKLIDRIAPAAHGLSVMSVQPLRSWPHDKQLVRGHFGFLDGMSQPVPVVQKAQIPQAPWSDEVALGEILLGRPGERDQAPAPVPALLADGSFLVMRKLRQHVGRLNDVMRQQSSLLAPTPAEQPALDQELREQLMGRRTDGRALAVLPPGALSTSNNFDYSGDPDGRLCPFHSHVRRSNPRRPPPLVPRDDQAKPGVPRLMRRGMSYGPATTGHETAVDDQQIDRGLVFMAVVASIAEQFEVVQRWIAGGNASGVLQQPGDPFLGVPTAGEKRVLRLLQPDGKTVRRIDLGDQPLVSLQWGLYLFLPTRAGLATLRDRPVSRRPRTPKVVRLPKADLDRWQRRLEDPAERAATWAAVRSAGGTLDSPYGTLHGSAAAVQAAFQDDGHQLSVCGYGQRMEESLGLGYLGQDTHSFDADVRPLADAVNRIIETVDIPKAYLDTRTKAHALLTAWRERAAQTRPPGRPLEVPLRLEDLGLEVLGKLCTLWFGLPDGHFVQQGPRVDSDAPGGPVHCPGHLLTVSRWVFSPSPSTVVEAQGRAQGQALRQAIKDALAAPQVTLTPMTQDIRQAAITWCGNNPESGVAADDLAARTLAGTLLGFPPTVLGNFINVMKGWIDTRELWALQQQWLPLATGATDDTALSALKDALLQRMAQDPVPAQLWRLPPEHRANPAAAPPARRQVLGIFSALQEEGADPMLMFGGARGATPPFPHACPGYGMAIGVLLGLLTTLLEAGELRPGSSNTQLLWRPA